MKLKSSIKLTNKYNIDEVIENKCLTTFIDLNSEIVEETKHEEETIIEYVYDAYQIELMYDEEYIKTNYNTLLVQAKQREYDVLAKQVRLKRKSLLEETDNYAMSDRVMSQAMKEYRQALRDITQQEGFPYEVDFPVKPME